MHKPDPAVPWADSVGAQRELLEAGTIRAAGISNVATGQIREAHAILGDGLVSVQNQCSPAVRDHEPELRLCTELGLTFLPWSPLGGISRSSLDGPSGPVSAGTAFHRVAAEHGVSPQRIALAWLLTRSPMMILVPGAGRPASFRDSALAVRVRLGTTELTQLQAALPRV